MHTVRCMGGVLLLYYYYYYYHCSPIAGDGGPGSHLDRILIHDDHTVMSHPVGAVIVDVLLDGRHGHGSIDGSHTELLLLEQLEKTALPDAPEAVNADHDYHDYSEGLTEVYWSRTFYDPPLVKPIFCRGVTFFWCHFPIFLIVSLFIY